MTTNLTHYQQAARLAAQLQLAMDSRATIEQAKGIIMATQRCTADQAFTVLTNLSQQRNFKLNQIAAALVARTGRR
ncbi:ANTAR domain-containing protein, partial [Variovorax sp. Varisp62]|uniref:ANTAR domain-containing protein n=1 Tax=Variovorax sp. Varisp62 TaxID=3243049 RepID=UPI0039B68F7F